MFPAELREVPFRSASSACSEEGVQAAFPMREGFPQIKPDEMKKGVSRIRLTPLFSGGSGIEMDVHSPIARRASTRAWGWGA